MIISRKRFEEEIQMRVEKAVCKAEENRWREEREREQCRFFAELERRLITVEKQIGIDHPSHQRDHTCNSVW